MLKVKKTQNGFLPLHQKPWRSRKQKKTHQPLFKVNKNLAQKLKNTIKIYS
jgi:hypothetical protein